MIDKIVETLANSTTYDNFSKSREIPFSNLVNDNLKGNKK